MSFGSARVNNGAQPARLPVSGTDRTNCFLQSYTKRTA